MSDSPDSTDSGYYGIHNMTNASFNMDHQRIGIPEASHVPIKTPFCICRECGQYITDRRLITMGAGQFWHQQCLRCSLCRGGLSDFTTCFMRDQNVYCKRCFSSAFAAFCSACRYPIAAGDWVRRVRGFAYHLGCFACDQCKMSLSTGESFLMIGQQIICENHMIKTGEPEPAVMVAEQKPFVQETAITEQKPIAAVEKAVTDQEPIPVEEPAAMKSEDTTITTTTTSSTSSCESPFNSTDGSPKRKRVRTTFNDHQLEILQTSFKLNDTPAATEMQHIAEMTGLSKKVAQVWFQNRRSRLRKTSATGTPKTVTNLTMGDFGMAQILNGTPGLTPMIKYEQFSHVPNYS